MRVVLSGGGTGGHIYPALAIARECKKSDPSSAFLYIGTEKGLESKLVREEGLPFESIEITGFRRKLSFENVKTVMRFLRGVSRQARYRHRHRRLCMRTCRLCGCKAWYSNDHS